MLFSEANASQFGQNTKLTLKRKIIWYIYVTYSWVSGRIRVSDRIQQSICHFCVVSVQHSYINSLFEYLLFKCILRVLQVYNLNNYITQKGKTSKIKVCKSSWSGSLIHKLPDEDVKSHPINSEAKDFVKPMCPGKKIS
jgi:hypothetical protein